MCPESSFSLMVLSLGTLSLYTTALTVFFVSFMRHYADFDGMWSFLQQIEINKKIKKLIWSHLTRTHSSAVFLSNDLIKKSTNKTFYLTFMGFFSQKCLFLSLFCKWLIVNCMKSICSFNSFSHQSCESFFIAHYVPLWCSSS